MTTATAKKTTTANASSTKKAAAAFAKPPAVNASSTKKTPAAPKAPKVAVTEAHGFKLGQTVEIVAWRGYMNGTKAKVVSFGPARVNVEFLDAAVAERFGAPVGDAKTSYIK